METINPIPQAVVPLTGPSASSQTSRRGKLPSTGQNLPSGSANQETARPEENKASVEVSSEALQETVDNLNGYAQNLKRNLQFSVDKDLGRTVIRVVDTDTKQVIRQIPSEEMLAIARRVDASASAILDVLA
jgi:flagellar protein FlaG